MQTGIAESGVPKWLEDWKCPSDDYEEYISTYDRYQHSLEGIKVAHSETEKAQKAFGDAGLLSDRLKKSSETRDDYRKSYIKEVQSRSVEDEYNRQIRGITDFHGRYTDSNTYESQRKNIIDKYQKQKDIYVKQRHSKLEPERDKYRKELENFAHDKAGYVNRRKEEICPGSDTVLSGKRKEITDYLTFSSEIKNSPISQKIMSIIQTEKPNLATSVLPEEKLLNEVMNLGGTDIYARKNKITANDVKAGNTTGSTIPFLIFLGIVFVVAFIYFAPFESFLSASAIAGTTQSVLQFLVNIILGLLGGVLIFGVVYSLFTYFEMEILGGIIGVIGGLYFGWKIYTDMHPTIETSSLMGAGGVIHGILIWIIQIILIAIVLFIVNVLISNTPLIGLFYKPKDNKVLKDLEAYDQYFETNKSTFINLFNIDLAMEYACTKSLSGRLQSIESSLSNIEKDSGYVEIENKCKIELKTLEKERDSERVKERLRRKTNDEEKERIRKNLEKKEATRIQNVKQKMNALNKAVEDDALRICQLVRTSTGEVLTGIAIYDRDKILPVVENFTEKALSIISVFLRKKIDCEEKTIEQSQIDKEYLIKETDRLVRIRSFKNIDCTKSVYKTEAKLSDSIYFISPQLDENGMAIVSKLSLKCIPIVGIYDSSSLQGDNLSEELSHFIEWVCVSIRRTTAQSIIDKAVVVDTFSGNSVLKTVRFNGFIDVIDDSQGIHSLEERFNEKERALISRGQSIYSQAKELEIADQLGDIGNIDALNKAIMLVDQDDIFENPDRPVEGEVGLWEKPVKYSFVIFIIPSSHQKSAGKSVITEELRKCFTGCARSGIVPIFLVDSDNWNHPELSDDISWIKNLRDKLIWNIENIGKERQDLLKISEA